MGITPNKKRPRRRGLRPSDRKHLERFCRRCGASMVHFFNSPSGHGSELCTWCEYVVNELRARVETKEIEEEEGV